MNDEKYIFVTDAAEKKKTARNIRNKNRTGKGPVRFPSDYMTKKEREALNGEVSTYNLRKPMKWKEFMSMPEDLQKQYLERLEQTMHPGNAKLAEMFGVSAVTVWTRCKALGTTAQQKGPRSKDDLLRWETFLRGTQTDKPQEPPEEKPDEVPEPPEPKSTEQKPFGVASGTFDAFASPAELAQMLSVIAGTDRRQYSVQFR